MPDDVDTNGHAGKATRTWSLKEAAIECHCNPEHLVDMVKRDGAPGAKIGRAWVFIQDDLLDWIRTKYWSVETEGPKASATPLYVPPAESLIDARLEKALRQPSKPKRSSQARKPG